MVSIHTQSYTKLHGIMSRLGRFDCKLLVLLCLSAVALSKESSNETETTTAKADVGSSEAETNRVETIHLHGQETHPVQKSYSYSEGGPGYLPDEDTGYNNQPHEDQSYEYGKRVGGGQYKGTSLDEYNSPALGYNHPQQEDHQIGYINSFKNYGKRQTNGHDQSGAKESYKQLGKQVEYSQEDYAKDSSAYDQGYSHGNDGSKQGAYVQGYTDRDGKKTAYGYDIPKIEQHEYVAANGYDSKNYAEQTNYGLENTKVISPKGYDDVSSYNAGSKSYNFPPKQPSQKTDYPGTENSGKSLSSDNAYERGSYSGGGKSSSIDSAYGSEGYSGGKSSSADIAYGPGSYPSGKSSGNIAYGSGGYSDGKPSSGEIAYGSGPHLAGKSSGNIAYGSGGYSGGKSSSGEIAYGSGPYLAGKSSGNIAYGSGGYSDGKSLSGEIAYGSGPYLAGKSSGNIAYGSGGYSGGKSSSGDIAYGPGPYSGEKLSGNIAYVSGGYSGDKSASDDISHGPEIYSGGKASGNIAYGATGHSLGGKSSSGVVAYESGLYPGGKSSENTAYGSTGHSSGEKFLSEGIGHGSGAYSSGAYAPNEKSLSGGIGYQSGASDYSPGAKSGGSAYSLGGKSSHFPAYPKEAGYISGGSKEPSYFHAVENGGSNNHKESGYYQGTPSKGSDLSTILHQGQSSKDSNHGKVSVFIKQLGHSETGNKYGSQSGERHGYLLLPVVPGKEGEKIKIATTGSYPGGEYKSSNHEDSDLNYQRSPIHATSGKSSFTSFFKTGGATYNSAYNTGANYGKGGESHGSDSKSEYKTGGDYGSGGNGGQKLSLIGQTAYVVNAPSYITHSGNPKGTSYSKEYTQQHSQGYSQNSSPSYEQHQNEYQEGGHGILSQNVKYIPAHEYQKQQLYASHDTSSYGKSVQPQQHIEKGTPYVRETPSYQLQGGHVPSPKGYDHGPIEQTSYGHESGPVAIPDNVKYVSQGHNYGKQQQSYGGHEVASYGGAPTLQKHSNGKGSEFQPTNYKFSTPIINPHASVVDFSPYGGSHHQKGALSNHGGESYGSGHQQSSGYGQSKDNASHKKPKSIALILQRHQGGHSESYKQPTFPVKSEATSKSLYSAQGFQPIIPKHLKGGSGRSTSLHYSVKSSQASPTYSSIDHTKGAGGRYY